MFAKNPSQMQRAHQALGSHPWSFSSRMDVTPIVVLHCEHARDNLENTQHQMSIDAADSCTRCACWVVLTEFSASLVMLRITAMYAWDCTCQKSCGVHLA